MHSSKYVILFLLLTVSTLQAQWVQSKLGLPDSWSVGFALDAYHDTTVVVSVNVGAFTPGWLYKTTNSGKKWSQLPTTELEIMDISMADPQHVWIVTGYGKLLASTNGGIDWTIQFEDTTKTGFFNYIRMFDLQNGIAMGDGKKDSSAALFLKTTDGGVHWISVNDSVFGGYSGDLWRRLSFINKDIGYFYSSGMNPQKMYKTMNGGTTWKATNLINYCEVVQFYNESIGLVIGHVGNNGGLKINRTVDGGTTWQTFDTPFEGWGNDIEFIKGDPSQVWATAGSLFYSNDTGRTWTKQFTTKAGRDIAFFGSTSGWILSDSGVFHTSAGPLVSENEHKEIILQKFLLDQNYPNPFNPSTVINYQLPVISKVSLKIYDLLGREIATLVNEEQSAGSKEVQWNAAGFASGVYFYRLQAGNYISIKKMTVMR